MARKKGKNTRQELWRLGMARGQQASWSKKGVNVAEGGTLNKLEKKIHQPRVNARGGRFL